MRNDHTSAFGLFDYTMIPKLRRVLKLYGLKLTVKSNYRKWGDHVEVTVIPLSTTKGK